jgi:hypothetical protein
MGHLVFLFLMIALAIVSWLGGHESRDGGPNWTS